MPGRDIFLSYSSDDDAIVRLALEKLEAVGHRCWFAPRDIPPGEFYAGQIIQALRESRFVLLFFSVHSNASEQVVREIIFAVSERLPMLVVRLDQTALSNDFEYLIRINQWLDLTHLSSDADRVAQIVARVQASVAKSGPKTSTAKAPVAMIFGDFEILADSSGKPIELGRGGMGVTYRARQISMGGREVALKVIQPKLLGDDNVRRRFLREAQLAGEIDHENVAFVHLRGQEGDSYFYAMQLVEGVDLDRYVKANGPLSVGDALSVIAQVASALTAANSKGLIHRDIKPSNLMAVRRRNVLRIKLIDFGLAKQITHQDIHNSLSGKEEFKGTLAYASPEQCQALPLDTRSDLYSLGVTLWFLLSGKVPFTGNLAAVSGAHIWAPLPRQQLPPLPQPVLELLQSLLAKSPADRPQTPGELEDRAEALLRSLPSDLLSGSETFQIQSTASSDASVGPVDSSTLVGAPVLISYLEPAVGQIREDRFELLESLPEGVSGRLFRACERRSSDSRIVAVKFLHPSICSQEGAAESLKTQFAALQKLTLDHLVRYLALELGSEPPFLVREWVHGLPLSVALGLKAGTLTPPEVSALLEPFPELLDALASSGLSLIRVHLSKLWARFSPDLEPAKSESWVKRATAQDWDSRLALDPLSLRSLVSRPVQGESDVTLLPTSRSLALQQNRAGIQGRTPAQLLASVVYELLAGQPPQTDPYRPLAISRNVNQLLKHALTYEGPDQSSASELWLGLKADFPQAPTPTQQPQSKPAPSTGPTPLTPDKPPAKPQPPPTPDHSGPQKANRARLWLILGSFAAFVCIILVGFWLSSHTGPPQPSPMPTPEPTVSPTPTATVSLTPEPTVSPTPKATPKPTASNDELASAAFDRGHAAAEKDDYQAAITDYSEVIRLRPDDVMAYLSRAICYDALGKKVEAQRDRAKAESLEKGSPEPTASQIPTSAPSPVPTLSPVPTATSTPTPSNDELASAAFNRGDFATEKDDYQTAINEFSEAIRLQPKNAKAFYNRGNAYYGVNQYDKAISDLTEAIRIKPDYLPAFFVRGKCFDAKRQSDAARLDLNAAVKLQPQSAEDYNSRGSAYAYLKQYDKAIADYSEAVRLKPDYATAFNNRGNAYNGLKQYDKAIVDYSEAIRLKSEYATAFYNRGSTYYYLKQYEKAIADLSEAIRFKPDFAVAFNNRGDASYGLKQYDKAIADFSEAIRLKSDYATAFNSRGTVYYFLKQYDKAIADYSEAIRLKPDFADAFNYRGNAYNGLKQYDKAIADFSEAVRLKPDYSTAYRNRAEGYDALGKKVEAKRDRAKAESLEKGNQ